MRDRGAAIRGADAVSGKARRASGIRKSPILVLAGVCVLAAVLWPGRT